MRAYNTVCLALCRQTKMTCMNLLEQVLSLGSGYNDSCPFEQKTFLNSDFFTEFSNMAGFPIALGVGLANQLAQCVYVNTNHHTVQWPHMVIEFC